VVVVGGTTTKPTVGVGLLSMGASGSPVRQPRHPTVNVLTVSTVGALTSWCTGQSGAAPDRYYSLSGAPSGAALTLRELSAHCSAFTDFRWSRPLRWSRCSAGTPDSPVRQPRHPTVRFLTVSTVGALTSWCTGEREMCPWAISKYFGD
jgi:hypothetical protein